MFSLLALVAVAAATLALTVHLGTAEACSIAVLGCWKDCDRKLENDREQCLFPPRPLFMTLACQESAEAKYENCKELCSIQHCTLPL